MLDLKEASSRNQSFRILEHYLLSFSTFLFLTNNYHLSKISNNVKETKREAVLKD
jgi:hypothetical protein